VRRLATLREDVAARPLPAADERGAAELAERLFREQGRMVRGICVSLLRDREDAEDAVQQTYLAAYKSLLRGNTPRDAAAWLAAIARNECRTYIRARMRRPLELVDDLDGVESVDAEVTRRADAAAIRRAVDGLPSQQRRAVVLREVQGLTYEETAARMGISTSAVESLLFRSRRRLQSSLALARAAGPTAVGAWLRDALAYLAQVLGPTGAASVPIAADVAAVAVAAVLAPAVVENGATQAMRAASPPPPALVAPAPTAVRPLAPFLSLPDVFAAPAGLPPGAAPLPARPVAFGPAGATGPSVVFVERSAQPGAATPDPPEEGTAVPANEEPVEEAPIGDQPADDAPADDPATGETPVEEVPEEPLPEEPAAEKPPSEAPVEEPPAEKPSAEDPAVEEPPAEEAPVEEPAAEEPPVENVPATEPEFVDENG
jgi:RNA polymerase sigma factor (sigma-70 family)